MFKKLLLDLIFPEECLNCQAAGALVCPACLNQLKFCLARQDAYLAKNNLLEIFIAGDYQDRQLASLIKKYKYNFLSRLGKILAQFLITFWQAEDIANIYPALKIIKAKPADNIILIPVPLTKRRQRWRGFNQAEILARELSVQLGYGLDLNLKRIKNRPPQASLDEAARLKNLQDVFYYPTEVAPLNLTNKIIILVDDVTTTGATLNAAAAALKRAGATKIYGLVLAKG